MFYDGFLHILNLREKEPNDAFLIKAQSKLMTLLVQKKYRLSAFDQFLNATGYGFSDKEAVDQRELLLSLNALEFNILALEFVKEKRTVVKDPYLDRIYNFLVQFFYKYNEKLFEYSNSSLKYVEPDSVSTKTVKVHDLDELTRFKEEEDDYFDELVEEKHQVYVSVNSSESSIGLTKQFITLNPLSTFDIDAIEKYKLFRVFYEETLPYKKFNIQIKQIT